MSRNFAVVRHHKNVGMTSVLFKMVEMNAWFSKVKLALLKQYTRERIQHAFVDRIDKSVPRVTVWHHSAEPGDGKQRPSEQNCLSYLIIIDSYDIWHFNRV